MNKMQKGFTLVELIIVIAVIGILAGTVLINVGGIRQSARTSSAQTSMAQLTSVMENAEYLADQNSYVTLLGSDDESGDAQSNTSKGSATPANAKLTEDTQKIVNSVADTARGNEVASAVWKDPARWAFAAYLTNPDDRDQGDEWYCVDQSGQAGFTEATASLSDDPPVDESKIFKNVANDGSVNGRVECNL